MAQSRSRLDVGTIVHFVGDILQFALSILQPRAQLAAENLFLRKQLALYLERQVKPRRAEDATHPGRSKTLGRRTHAAAPTA
jgi:hypothetical protein